MAAQLTKFGWLAFGALTAATGACSDDTAPAMPATSTCEPFEAHSEPGALMTVLAAGRGMSGVIYVVDGSDGDLRAFIGTETMLTRLHVIGGSGSDDGSIERYTLTIDEQPSYTLIVEKSATETRIARTLDVELRDPAIDNLAPGDELTLIDPATLDDAEVVDVTAGIAIDYLARLPNDDLILIIVPTDEDGIDYEAFRVFFGRAGSLIEQPLIEVTRARDGGSTHVVFELDGSTADAFFPVDLSGMNPMPATLDHDSELVELERIEPSGYTELLQEARFECLE
jgi:hypothetical protein